jgi:rubredoxin
MTWPSCPRCGARPREVKRAFSGSDAAAVVGTGLLLCLLVVLSPWFLLAGLTLLIVAPLGYAAALDVYRCRVCELKWRPHGGQPPNPPPPPADQASPSPPHPAGWIHRSRRPEPPGDA